MNSVDKKLKSCKVCGQKTKGIEVFHHKPPCKLYIRFEKNKREKGKVEKEKKEY